MSWDGVAYRTVRTAIRRAKENHGEDLKDALLAIEIHGALSLAGLLRDQNPVIHIKKLSRWEHFLHAIGRR